MNAQPYTPRTGDTFTKGEHVARVSMMSGGPDGHVVVIVDGKEYTMGLDQFVTMARKTLENGAVLTASAKNFNPSIFNPMSNTPFSHDAEWIVGPCTSFQVATSRRAETICQMLNNGHADLVAERDALRAVLLALSGPNGFCLDWMTPEWCKQARAALAQGYWCKQARAALAQTGGSK